MSFDWMSWYSDLQNFDGSITEIPLIAEAGINHNGEISKALELVSLAKETGCHAVKFQKRQPEICVPLEVRGNLRETPWGTMTYFDYKERIEFSIDEYRVIDEHARNIGIDWFVSAWDVPSQIGMRTFGLKLNKVASAMVTHLPLLQEIASERKLTFLSTGMSTLKQIETAVDIFKEAECPVVLMHTVSNYPAQDEQLNLKVIETLKSHFKLPVGYSGHESSVSPSIVAAAMGAVAIERHVTLDRSMWGTDQAASLEKSGLLNLSSVLGRIPKMIGNGEKRISQEELKAAKNLRYFEQE